MTVSLAELRTRAERGARRMDTYDPNWVHRVNLSVLELVSTYRCVLGQCFGTYADGVDALNLVMPTVKDEDGEIPLTIDDEIVQLGFDLTFEEACNEDGDVVNELSYADLTEAWRELIVARRDAASATT